MIAGREGGSSAFPTSAAGAAGSGGGGTYYAPPPGSIDAAQGYAGATDAYRRALIRFNAQRTGMLKQYGYQGDIDPENGMVKNLRVDGANVHGALQELLGQQANEDDQADYAAQDRGLHGGLAHQASSALHFRHGGQTGQLGQQLLGQLGDLDSQQLDAHSALDAALWQLQHSATTDAVDSGDFNPATYEDDPAPFVSSAARAPASAKKPAPKKKAPTLVSENGRGGGNSRAKTVAKIVANAYTNGSKKRG